MLTCRYTAKDNVYTAIDDSTTLCAAITITTLHLTRGYQVAKSSVDDVLSTEMPSQ